MEPVSNCINGQKIKREDYILKREEYISLSATFESKLQVKRPRGRPR